MGGGGCPLPGITLRSHCFSSYISDCPHFVSLRTETQGFPWAPTPSCLKVTMSHRMLIKSTYHTFPTLPFVTGVQTTPFSHLCTPPSRFWVDLSQGKPTTSPGGSLYHKTAQLVAMGQTFQFFGMLSVSSKDAAILEVTATLWQMKLRHLTVFNGPLLTL